MTTLTTVLLEIVPADGTAAWKDAWAGPGYRSFQATPPWTFGDWIDGNVPVTIRHGGPVVGHLDYAEYGLGHGNGALFGIATLEGVDAADVDGKAMCSAEIRANGFATTIPTTVVSNGRMRSSTRSVGDMHATESRLDAVALVDQTASITSTRCRAWNGDYRDPLDWSDLKSRRPPAILERAAKAATSNLRYRRPDAVRIHHPDRHGDEYHHDQEHRHGGRPEVIHHGGGYVLGIRSA